MDAESYLITVVCFLWFVGFLREFAKVCSIRDTYKIQSKVKHETFGIALVLFFTWPYWMFYGKSR